MHCIHTAAADCAKLTPRPQVYPDKRGKAVMRALGDVHGSRRTADDSKTLRTLKFEIGDFLAVSIYS